MPAITDLDFIADMGRMNGAFILNRKNVLFAGSDAGAEHWATIASSKPAYAARGMVATSRWKNRSNSAN
ncbi:hypothetical protein RLEG12_00540 (plasmid) [Rhizobium leguminosarum bv. trifolii CB782]|nr:hypothetical protein RLEG12_00540 [Rhizobium leguminosarum bv. trifolii CB782]